MCASWHTDRSLIRSYLKIFILFFSNIFKPAAPFVFSKGGDQMRFEWVLMDIPKQCQKIIPVSNWLALESLLKEMSYSSILGTMSRFVLLPNC